MMRNMKRVDGEGHKDVREGTERYDTRISDYDWIGLSSRLGELIPEFPLVR
jgi:hypothetical protein